MATKALKYWRLAMAAAELGIARQTLQSAVERGEITAYTTACGLPLVDLDEVRKWSKKERRPGRKPAAK